MKFQKKTNSVVTVALMKVMNDHRSKFSNLSSWKEKPEKNQGFNGIFQASLSNCLSWKIYCDDHSLLSSKTAVQI